MVRLLAGCRRSAWRRSGGDTQQRGAFLSHHNGKAENN
jgi:hypothetical protein